MWEESNALLQPMETEDFRTTNYYCRLQAHEEAAKQICGFLMVDHLSELEFVANPDTGLYTPYDQEDFEEVAAYLDCCGETVKALNFEGEGKHYLKLAFVETGVGRFVVGYDMQGKVIGIFS